MSTVRCGREPRLKPVRFPLGHARAVRRLSGLILLLFMLAVGGCSNKESVHSVAALEGQTSNAWLAYEHTVTVALPAARLAEAMADARSACTGQRFGSCSLLEFEQSTGDYASGKLVVRLQPDAIEPFLGLVDEAGQIDSISTRAEDLAQAAEDLEQRKQELLSQLGFLDQLQARSDLSAADLMALVAQRARITTELDALAQSGRNLARRTETNLLTVRYSASSGSLGEIASALRNTGRSFGDGFAEAIEAIAYGAPFLILGFPLLLLWRWAWRKTTR